MAHARGDVVDARGHTFRTDTVLAEYGKGDGNHDGAEYGKDEGKAKGKGDHDDEKDGGKDKGWDDYGGKDSNQW